MQSFIEDILNYHLIQNGLLKIAARPFNPHKALEFVLGMFAKKAEMYEIKLDLEVRKNLPKFVYKNSKTSQVTLFGI